MTRNAKIQITRMLLSSHGVRKESKLSVKKAIALPSNTKIILLFNKELSLGADYSNFSICEESWKHVNKAKKEHAYNMTKDDAERKIKRKIMQRLGKNWKDNKHKLYHKCYKETRTFEKNLEHRPKGIEEDHWKWFFEYRQKEETKEAIANVERQDESSKQLSQNDSLAQVLGKEHPRRVRALGAGPYPTQVFGNTAGQPSGSGELNKEYLIQQQGGNLPSDVAAELDYLGSTPTSSRARPSSSCNHDPQQK
ncbi:hypothetical protein Ahy_B04g071914 [Arachis hypogaea]|uniref:Uncharacterized protein n=1 Tax=Arachis hypogaea TaxID=3818 RepID=A0A444ZLZ8_ARAHY|nr:hypothetical protein Ahy_B04g071914 [Arachis hypogaea]